MEPIRSRFHLVHDEGATVTRDGDSWVFTWGWTDVNSVVEERVASTTEQLLAHGPPVGMTADELDALARQLGHDPASVAWCRERRLLERLVADDAPGVRALLGAPPTLVTRERQPEPLLMVALGVAAWSVAAELVDRGEPLASQTYAIAALDDSDGALAVLDRLLARGQVVADATLLRYVRAPRVARALVAAGARVDVVPPATTDNPAATIPDGLLSATPLALHAALGHMEVATTLADLGAPIDQRDGDGCTALLLSVYWGREAPVRFLLERGADPDAASSRGNTPRSLALKRPDDPSSRALLTLRPDSPR